MGIQKSIEFDGTGIVLNYWRINCVTVDIEQNYTSCRVGGYVLKSDALAGKRAVTNINYEFRGSNNPIHIDTNPLDYNSLIYSAVVAPPSAFLTNKLSGGEIVSDAP